MKSNKFKIELTAIDEYERLGEEPYEEEGIKLDLTQYVNEILTIEGEIKVTKIEE